MKRTHLSLTVVMMIMTRNKLKHHTETIPLAVANPTLRAVPGIIAVS